MNEGQPYRWRDLPLTFDWAIIPIGAAGIVGLAVTQGMDYTQRPLYLSDRTVVRTNLTRRELSR